MYSPRVGAAGIQDGGVVWCSTRVAPGEAELGKQHKYNISNVPNGIAISRLAADAWVRIFGSEFASKKFQSGDGRVDDKRVQPRTGADVESRFGPRQGTGIQSVRSY